MIEVFTLCVKYFTKSIIKNSVFPHSFQEKQIQFEIFKNLNERNISVSFNEGSILKLNISRVSLGVIINIRRFDEKLLLKLNELELFYEGYSWLIIGEENNYFKAWEIIRELHTQCRGGGEFILAQHPL